MGVSTKIQWTHHTFNPWRGCVKVSAGCAHCYAEKLSARNPAVLGEWGAKGRRAIAAESYWKLPLRWDREAKEAGERRRVFCASLGDVFEDRDDLIGPRDRLWELIGRTPNLDWLLLTKRPQNWRRCWPLAPVPGHVSQNDGDGKTWRKFPNVWLGTSVEDQEWAQYRVGELLSIPAAIHFISAEPLIGPVDFGAVYCTKQLDCECPTWYDALDGVSYSSNGDYGIHGVAIDWVIVGGESGHGARPCDLAWIRSIRDQCRATGVPLFVKQMGARPVADPDGDPVGFLDPKGGDIDEWPEDLRIREFPR